MPVRAAGPLAGASPAVGGPPSSFSGRVRSASPARRALAIDMRRIANLLRDPPSSMLGADNSVNTSICSSPQSAWEIGERGADARTISSARSPAPGSRGHGMVQNQINSLLDKVNNMVNSLQGQAEADRRRVTQLERRLESRLEEKAREGDGREKWAEIQGSVKGLIEETQALTRRVEGLDERLWARTSGSEIAKQRNRELEQQVQNLEQQSRLISAATEETQKRQATKIRRVEHSLEEATRRLVKVEEEARARHGGHQQNFLDSRVAQVEQQQEQLDAELRQLQMQVDEAYAVSAEGALHPGENSHEPRLDEAIQAAEHGLATLEKKVSTQIEDLASSVATLRVKVDGHHQRVGTLAERMETAHKPAMESLHQELTQGTQQHRRELDSELAALKTRLQETVDANEEALTELREALRHAHAEIAAFSLRPDDSPVLHAFD